MAGSAFTSRGLPALGLISLAVASLYQPCLALGLDEAEVSARIGQPLAVSVPLRVSVEEARYVEARLVRVKSSGDQSAEEAGIAAKNFRTQVVADRRGRLVVEVSSLSRMREPYLEFTVEVSSRSLRVQREFTVFIDPPGADFPQSKPETMVASAPETVEPIVAATAAVMVAQAEPAAPAPEPAPRREVRHVAIVEEQPGVHVVHDGDTLYSVARTFAKRHGLSTAQAVDRLYKANPGAFRGSPDMMLAGARLSLRTLDDSAGMLAAATPPPAAIRSAKVEVAPPPAIAPAPVVVATAAPTVEPAPAVAADSAPHAAAHAPEAAPAAESRSLLSMALLDSAQAAPTRPEGIALKLDSHIAAPIAVSARRSMYLSPMVLLSAVVTAILTAGLWFGGLGLMRRRLARRPRRA
jgi:hypothetical protein